jgi:transposase
MPDQQPRSNDSWEDLLDQACRRSKNGPEHPPITRRSLSILPDHEREELDLYLSTKINEEESEAMAECLSQLESLVQDRPQALELLEHVRQDVARTALRCIEQSYHYGKRKGHKEALDLLLPYLQETSPSV